jgi:uncharacterized protein YdhG (YjbR/CyaY superfamily)
MEKYCNIDEYIACFPQSTRQILEELRLAIRKIVPEAEEAISYGIPTFKLKGNLVHFAAYKNHIAFYPGAAGIENFKEKLSSYNLSKGTVQFPIDKPIPYDLIIEIVNFRVAQNLHKAGQKKSVKK